MTPRDALKEMLRSDLGFEVFPGGEAPEKRFRILIKSPGILCGMIFVPEIVDIVEREFFLKPFGLGSTVRILSSKKDGDTVSPGDIVAELIGDAEVLLKAERTILNVLSRLSGIATHVAKEVARVAHTGVKLLDTRKDPSILRMFDKYALELGGGHPHRAGFYDGVIVKDNDIAIYGVRKAMDLAVRRARFLTKIEVEVGSLSVLEEALLDGRADTIMLDNMSLDELTVAVGRIRLRPKHYEIEASGIGEYNPAYVAYAGVDAISISSLVTKGAGNPLDCSMKVV